MQGHPAGAHSACSQLRTWSRPSPAGVQAPPPAAQGAVRPSGGHSLHGRTQPHTSTSGHGHTSAAPPHASMLSQDGEEATGSKRCWTLGPRARQDKEAACSQPRVSPAASLQGVGTGLQGWSRRPAEVAGPWQPGLLTRAPSLLPEWSQEGIPGGVTQSHPGRGTLPLSLLSPGPTMVQLRE